MKRQLIIGIVAFAIFAKLFSVVMVKVRETSNHDVVATNLPFDQVDLRQQAPQEHIQSNVFPQTAREKARPVRTYTTPIKSLDFNRKTKAVAKKADKKAAKIAALEKKEKDRRKKRRKKLEEMTAKKAEVVKPQLSVVVNHTDNAHPSNDGDMAPYSNFFYTPSSNVPNTNPPVVAQTEQPKPVVNLARWISLLTSNPKTSDVTKFMSLYQTGAITSAQYYHVVALMQKSTTVAIRKYSVDLASFEPHKLAFAILAEEGSVETNQEVYDNANKGLAKYQDVKYLSIMSDSLGSGTVYSKIKASDTVNTVALAFKESRPSQDPKTLFQPFVPLLQVVIQDQTSSPQLIQSAQTTLATINSVISTSTVAGLL